MEILAGLLRDFVVALIGVLILFDLVAWTDEQIAGVLLLLATALAMGTWAYKAYQAERR